MLFYEMDTDSHYDICDRVKSLVDGFEKLKYGNDQLINENRVLTMKLDLINQNPKNYIIRIGDGLNFWNSDRYSVWGISETGVKTLQKNAVNGDRLWFCTKESNGKLVAVANYSSIINRFQGDEAVAHYTNDKFRWTGGDWTSKYLIKYSNRINIEELDILSKIKGPSCVRSITPEAPIPSGIDLDELYGSFVI